jgi:hypothetical protein
MLISAFVDAHTSAQQLISQHLTQLSTATAADGESALANSKLGKSPAGAAAYDAAAAPDVATPASSHSAAAAPGGGSRSVQQQQLKQGSLQQQEEESDGELQAARLVLQESKDEVAAALQYAHEVSCMRSTAVWPVSPLVGREIHTWTCS